KGAKELPRPEYAAFDAAPTRKQLGELSGVRISDTTIREWVERHAESIEAAALMLAGMGTPAFFEYGRKLYGEPKAKLVAYPTTPLELAASVRDVVNQLHVLDIDLSPPRTFDAAEVAEQLKTATAAHFGASAPKIEIVDVLSANALAGASKIKVRRGARFTHRDAPQLLPHQAYLHLATA